MNAPTITSGDIRDTRLADAISERYLSYALSIIMSRSLPDVRDGLKPVHRRLLYAMRQLKLDPDQGFKKCARVVGDVMGKYHPHGDQSIYDALVRLAQEFSVRYPLVDGQGNFGNVDGDNPAAMRYTEARMTEVATALLDGIDEDAIDFRETYDGQDKEPIVLPAAIPNLLANGAAGIAVGMATSIPPHNLEELCSALIHLIKFPKATIGKLVDFIPGPDFPTGGVLVEDQDVITAAYKIGRGGFRIRARWEKEKLGRGQYQIIITEIPYQVQKSRLIEKIAELLLARKLPFLADIRDESAEDIRVVLEPKNRTIEPEMLMEQMFKLTELESRFSMNMNVLDADNTPKVMNLREVLTAFLDHRLEVLMRRTKFRLGKIEARMEVLEGYLIAYLNLDEVIRIIREADNAKASLIKKFKLTENQAEAILNMRLRSLRKLEEIEIKGEHEDLKKERVELNKLVKNKDLRWKKINSEIVAIKKQFSGKADPAYKRRTEITSAPDVIDIPVDAFIEKEPVTVIYSEKGWIKAAKGHVDLTAEVKYKEGDHGKYVLHAETTDKILLFATNGRFYTISCDKLPGGRGFGEPVRLMIDLGNEHDIVGLFLFKPEMKFLAASSSGRGFIVKSEDVMAQTKGGKQILNVKGEDEAAAICIVEGDSVAVIGENRKLLLFPLDEIPEMTRGRGVILQRYKDGGLGDIKTFTMKEGLSWKTGDKTRTETDLMAWQGKRAQAGRLPPKGFSRTNKFS
ncbi:MAG: DNA topoisomerase IV subunit A [Rhodospirillaceae bacterium]|jgi:topoisomerase IV subunit A|nr:DNA topoisomerase IV subunit A [Rhodospirillaceae bacterium]